MACVLLPGNTKSPFGFTNSSAQRVSVFIHFILFSAVPTKAKTFRSMWKNIFGDLWSRALQQTLRTTYFYGLDVLQWIMGNDIITKGCPSVRTGQNWSCDMYGITRGMWFSRTQRLFWVHIFLFPVTCVLLFRGYEVCLYCFCFVPSSSFRHSFMLCSSASNSPRVRHNVLCTGYFTMCVLLLFYNQKDVWLSTMYMKIHSNIS